MRTIAAALREAAGRLAEVSPAPRLDAEWLMAHALETDRPTMLLRRMNDREPDGFAAMIARRAAGEPLAHITGSQPFFGLELAVSPAVLVPRGDSEILIDAARDRLAERPPERILDCGTGSGALLLAALSIWPDARGLGIDRSAAAIEVARANAAALDLDTRARMIEADWTGRDFARACGGRFDLILANPPYVGEDDPDLAEEVRRHEPAGALLAGPDGLAAYRALLPQLAGLLRPGGVAVVEIGARQAAAVARIAGEAGLSCALRHDLSGRPRALVLCAAAKSRTSTPGAKGVGSAGNTR